MATTTANQQPIVPAKSGKLKRILIIAIGAIVLLGAGAGGAYFLLGKSGHASKPAPPPPVFFPLDSLTVNLQADDGIMHYLRVGLTLKLKEEKAQAALTERMPEIRSRVLLILSAKHPEDLATIDGKRKLAAELRSAVESIASTPDHPVHVDDVLFTEFVVQ
ncbi:flagellar basal body-associated protein FliL [Caballeronia concitans]|uniref:Flagellar protein FliL n=1 Tax=Caballeronia concitans TaxID=1777133 RepID=A0A658QQ59_9BURK|nr:flagellar basal body-associated protein FliL [Caballeronia concitans]KIG02797.1 flagellar basal body-associated protein FliL [Burkholderia sp. MR1]SAL09380.1 flagellar basal body-associated protein FliL [Caballeronia concitans]